MKAYQEMKKKEASRGRVTAKKSVVHSTRYVVVVNIGSWASVTSSDDDDELLPSVGSTFLTKREC